MINYFLKRFLLAAVIFAIASAGYILGSYQTELRINLANEKKAVDNLASELFMLQELEKGNSSETIQILQASTGPNLDLIMQYWDRQQDIHFRCGLVKKLRDYRERKSLFRGPQWENLWKVSGMREAEDKRIHFLNELAPSLCQSK